MENTSKSYLQFQLCSKMSSTSTNYDVWLMSFSYFLRGISSLNRQFFIEYCVFLVLNVGSLVATHWFGRCKTGPRNITRKRLEMSQYTCVTLKYAINTCNDQYSVLVFCSIFFSMYFSIKVSVHGYSRHFLQMVSQISRTSDFERQYLRKRYGLSVSLLYGTLMGIRAGEIYSYIEFFCYCY